MGEGGNTGLGSEQERARRYEVLRQLASEQSGQDGQEALVGAATVPAELRPVSRGRRSRRAVWAVGAGVLAVVLVAVVVLVGVVGHSRGSSAPAGPTIQHVAVTAGGLGCAFAAQYAPDGKTVAVLAGPSGDCSGQGDHASYPTSLILYDTATMRPKQTIELVKAITSKVSVPAGMQITGGSIGPHTFFWSQDGQRIAVFFGAPLNPVGSTQPSTDYLDGVAVLQVSTQALQVISASSEPVYPSDPSISPSSYEPVYAWLVNLSAGTMKPVREPQALAYSWQADGSVAVATPLPTHPDDAAATSAGGPLTPYGATFGVWQGAQVQVTQYPCVNSYFQAELGGTLAWSPDGNEIFQASYTVARLAAAAPILPTPTTPPGINPMQCTPSLLSQFPSAEHLAPIAPRDAGMRGGLGLIKADARNPTQWDVAGLAFNWTADGKHVAVVPTSASDSTVPYIAIYDSQNGKQLAQYSATKLDPKWSASNSNLSNLVDAAWSPDGKTLLVPYGTQLILITR